ncbi:hypothetical protein BASA60_004752 [Batrachochytrium salamandrivorans]|nr:hypothetical protein BASA60_004752 [Batrachochytrium salamandrivorans]
MQLQLITCLVLASIITRAAVMYTPESTLIKRQVLDGPKSGSKGSNSKVEGYSDEIVSDPDIGSNGEKPNGESSTDKRSNGEKPNGESSTDKRSNGEKPNGESSTDKRSNGEKPNDESSTDKKSNDEKPNNLYPNSVKTRNHAPQNEEQQNGCMRCCLEFLDDDDYQYESGLQILNRLEADKGE